MSRRRRALPALEPSLGAEPARGRRQRLLPDTDAAFAAPAEVSDERIRELRELGYPDEQISEVVALVALQLHTSGHHERAFRGDRGG